MARQVKFGMEIYKKHSYTLCVKVNNYKYGDGAKLWGYIQQMLCRQNVSVLHGNKI
jgi:hypothetical protein